MTRPHPPAPTPPPAFTAPARPAPSLASQLGLGLAIAGLLALGLVGPLNLLLSVPAVVLSARGLRADGRGPVPVVGLVLALAGTLVGVGALVFVLVVVHLVEGWHDGVSQALEMP